MRIAYDWDNEAKAFQKTAPCLCPAYRGERPGHGDCPHEYVLESKNCVHCGHVMAH